MRKRTRRAAVLGAALVGVALLPAGLAGAQTEQRRVLNIQGIVLDLESTVLDTGGNVTQVETPQEVQIRIATDVLFAFDRSDLSPRAAAVLREAADTIRAKARAGGTIRVEGHTDGKGTPAYNRGLSNRRAAAVEAELTRLLGGGSFTMATRGFGETRPIAPNTEKDGSDNPEGRRRNRRVEIRFGR